MFFEFYFCQMLISNMILNSPLPKFVQFNITFHLYVFCAHQSAPKRRRKIVYTTKNNSKTTRKTESLHRLVPVNEGRRSATACWFFSCSFSFPSLFLWFFSNDRKIKCYVANQRMNAGSIISIHLNAKMKNFKILNYRHFLLIDISLNIRKEQ